MKGNLLQNPAIIGGGEFFQNGLEEIKGIKANVVFGKISRDCAGIGICKVTVNTVAGKTNCNCPTAKAIINRDQYGQIGFYFPKKSLSLKSRIKFFQRDYFLVGESFVLPQAVTQGLGLHNPVIEAGEYPMVKRKDYICVMFPAG